MDAACVVEEQKRNNRRSVPLDIVAEILVNLPTKHLLLFSSVSKSWRSLIFNQSFIKKRAATAGDPRRLLMTANHSIRPCYEPRLILTDADASSCSLSSISYDDDVEDATPIVCPIEGTPILRASCGELWCVEANNSLYLWNPSIRSYKKIPNSSDPNIHKCICGLGYDSVSDDYKIFRLYSASECTLYSLRTDSWKKTDQIFPVAIETVEYRTDVFVSGAFHWMVRNSETIISFDLATEKYGSVAAPPHYRMVGEELPRERMLEVDALNGKLCVVGKVRPSSTCIKCRNYISPLCVRCLNSCRFVLWVMEEYGIEKSWTKIFDINYGDQFPPDVSPPRVGLPFWEMEPISLKPLYLFENDEILFSSCIRAGRRSRLFVYKGEEATPWKLIYGEISDHAFVYDEAIFHRQFGLRRPLILSRFLN